MPVGGPAIDADTGGRVYGVAPFWVHREEAGAQWSEEVVFRRSSPRFCRDAADASDIFPDCSISSIYDTDSL